MTVHFQPLPNAFEVFGVDFLVDAAGTAWLLEINAFPDFKQTGDDLRLREVVAEFWADVLRLAVRPFATGWGDEEGGASGARDGVPAGAVSDLGSGDMILVRDVDLGRRWA